MSMEINRRLSLRRALWGAAVAWTACFAVLPTYSATATLSGVTTNNCTYTSTAIDALGNITVSCNTVPQPGQIAFAQSTYSANINDTAFPVQVNRNIGTQGVVGATVTVAGGCSVNGGGTTSVSFSDGGQTPQALTVNTTMGSPSTCTLTLSAATGGATLGGPATINVIDPTQPGTFSFASATSSATTGVTNHNVVIQRTGGSNGAYDLAFTATPTGLTGYSATVSPIQFSSGQTSANIVVTAGTTAGTVLYTLTGATPVAPNVTPTSLGATVAHTVTVSTSSSCPAPGSNVTVLTTGAAQTGHIVSSGPAGSILAIPIPATATRIQTGESSQTPLQGFGLTFAISRCPGNINRQAPFPASGPVPCQKSATRTGNSLDLLQAPTFFKCHWLPADRAAGGYYMNIYIDSCDIGNCSFMYQMNY